MTKIQIEDGIRLCMKKVTDLLSDVEILCNNNGNEATAVAIYTIAIEEYGKSLLLKKYLQNKPRNDNNLEVSKTIFGFQGSGKHGHNQKFEEAIRDLPNECVDYQKVDAIHGGHNLPPKHREYAKKVAKETLEIQKKMPYVTFGAGYVIPFDFEVRKNLLYVDWDNDIRQWRSTLNIEPYRYERIKKWGYQYDKESGCYIKRDAYGVTVTNFPYVEDEIELSGEEIYPGILLNAIQHFREHMKNDVK